MSVFTWLTSAMLGPVADENEAIVRLSLFILIFALFGKSLSRLFPENKFVANVLALVIGLISVRLMPLVWLMPLGKFIWVLALLVVPYLLVDALVHEWALLKIVFLVAAYFFVYLLVVTLNFWGFGLVMESVAWAKEMFYYNRWQSVFAVLIIVLIVIMQSVSKKNKEKDWKKL